MHRRLYIFEGSANWCRQAAKKSLRQINDEHCIWFGNKDGIPHGKAKSFLGQTIDVAVFDASEHFSPDAFGIVTGAIRGGGCLLLLLPPQISNQNRFLTHLHRVVSSTPSLVIYRKDDEIPPIYVEASYEAIATTDQLAAIKAIEQVVYGHRNRPLVMTADRGRGKSAALGLASKSLLATKLDSVILTAPSKAAVNTVFEYADHNKSLVFLSPDELLRQSPKAELLLIDEAAAIPVPILVRLLKQYSRVVFSTTVHGYEGSGKGFAIRFKKILNQQTPQWQSISLSEPIRWSKNDPLETFVNDVLLLNADMSDLSGFPLGGVERYQLEKLDRNALITNKDQLDALFGLLVTAHYQTKPSDIAYLLNDEKVGLYAVIEGGHILAVICAEEEGGFSGGLSEAIYQGSRRIKGHLIPQSLTFHSGIEQASELVCQRIIRIAVHPELQGAGLGQRIVRQFVTLVAKSTDYVGTSFACTSDVLAFWQKCEFSPARLGLKRDASNGTHSLMMLKPLSPLGCELVDKAEAVFKDALVYQMPEVFREFETELLIILLSSYKGSLMPMLKADEQELDSFCHTHRGYEVCLPAITRFAQQVIFTTLFVELDVLEKQILIDKVLKKLSWNEVVTGLELTGKREAEMFVKSGLAKLLKNRELS
jgi:tRNA(Met) cytidine acetyltransferase